jgi:hypothetical protein
MEGQVKRIASTVLLVALAVACRESRYRNPLAGTEYLARVPEDELAGTWTLSRQAEASLQLRADHSCSSSAEVTAYFQRCRCIPPRITLPPGVAGQWRKREIVVRSWLPS